MRNVRLSRIALALISGLVAAGCAMAQSKPLAAPGMQAQQTAGISVLVDDFSGAMIPRANVQLQKEHGEAVANGVTDQAGLVTFANLPAGSYLMEVSAQGFKTERPRVNVEVGNTMHLEIRLAVGGCNTCVEAVQAPVEIDHSTETEVQPISYVQLIPLPRPQKNLFRRFLRKIGHGAP